MTATRVSLETVEDFLAQKRIAMVGLSRGEKDFSVMLFREFVKRGYDMVPVNPGTKEILGKKCYARVEEIQPAVDGVILMTSPAVTEAVVEDCARAGVKRIWMYSAGVAGATSPRAVAYCWAHGMKVVPGECPFMFWRGAGFGHRLHGFVLKIAGKYPQRSAPAAA